MNYSEQDLIQAHAIELEILIRVINICRENDIEYFMSAGTALGAVRHGGFIPWDDDIDIGMRRDQFEKFSEIAQEGLGSEYFFQTRETDPNYPNIFAKVRKNNTTFLEWSVKDIDMHHGIYIDIFPYDNVPQDAELRRKQSKRIHKYYKLLLYRACRNVSRPPKTSTAKLRQLLKKFVQLATYCIPLSSDVIYKRLTDEVKRYTKQDTGLYTEFWIGKHIVYPEDILFPTTPIIFEGMEVQTVNDTDSYLTLLYGDYMKLPPESQRVGHQPFVLKV